MKRFNGKAIYNPSGKAGEYSYWACNFYTGCSNGCTYCYCRKGVLGSVWSNKPALKKCFKNEDDALFIFEKELKVNIGELRKHGLFFSFTTDSLLPETIGLTIKAIKLCVFYDVNVKVLTKRADFAERFFTPLTSENPILEQITHIAYTKNVAFGFTLTGHDDLEPNASPNADRIRAMKILHDSGYKTFASIEPVIDFDSSMKMIQQTIGFCDLYKVGLESGKKYYNPVLLNFVNVLAVLDAKFYLKESITKLVGSYMATSESFVSREYNIFENKQS